MFHPCIHIDAGVAPIETLITFGALSVGKPLKGGKGGRVSDWMKIGLREMPDRFRVVLNKPFFDKLLLDGKNKMGTWEKLAEKLGITYGSLVDMRNGEIGSTSVAALKTLAPIAGETLDEIEKNCSYTLRVQSAPIKIPISSTSQLAALVAHALGDGSIGRKHLQVEYKNKNLECIQEVLEAVKSVFNIQVSVAEYERNIYSIMLPSTIGHVLCIVGAISGNKTEKDFDVPDWIKNGSLEIKRSFLRALFNDEGSVNIGIKSSNIRIFMGKEASKKNSIMKFFESVQHMLMDFGIKSKRVRISREYWVGNQKKVIVGFWITGKKNLKAFATRIGLCPTKQKKLEIAINSYKNHLWGEEIKDEILCILHLKGPKTTTELSKILERNPHYLVRVLHKLESNGDISFSRYVLPNRVYGFRWRIEKGGEKSG